MLGLEAAMDLVELAEEEQDQQAPTHQSGPHPERPVVGSTPDDRKPGGTPQNCPNAEEAEGLLESSEEGGPSTGTIGEDGQDKEPSRGGKKEKKAKASRGAQDDTPTLEDSQVPGQPPPKEF